MGDIYKFIQRELGVHVDKFKYRPSKESLSFECPTFNLVPRSHVSLGQHRETRGSGWQLLHLMGYSGDPRTVFKPNHDTNLNPNPNPNLEPNSKPNPNPNLDPNFEFTMTHKTKYLRSGCNRFFEHSDQFGENRPFRK